MTAQPGFNPSATTNAAGSFNVSSTGLVAGTYYEDPVARFALASGFLLNAETVPMWGGVAIYGDVPTGSLAGTAPAASQGLGIGRATALTGSKALLGWSVFNQAYGMYDTPQSPVPLAGSYNQVMYLPLGSGARIAVACDPALTSLRGGNVLANVSWDWNNQLLVPYTASLTFSSGSYNNTTGIVSITFTTAELINPGDSIVVSSLTGSNITSQNGTYTILTVSGDTITYQAAAGAGATTITGGTFVPGGGSDVAIPVKVLDVQASNCMIVSYDPIAGNATWNRNGACAVIQI